MKTTDWITLICLIGVSLFGCQKYQTPKAVTEQAKKSLSISDTCMSLAKAAFGEDAMRDYSVAEADYLGEDYLFVEFKWAEGKKNRDIACGFKPINS